MWTMTFKKQIKGSNSADGMDGEETRKAETGEAERRWGHLRARPHMSVKYAESAELKDMLANSGKAMGLGRRSLVMFSNEG